MPAYLRHGNNISEGGGLDYIGYKFVELHSTEGKGHAMLDANQEDTSKI